MPLAAFPKCCLDALCVTKTMMPTQWIDRVADTLDIDGLEFYAGFLTMDDPETLIAYRKHAESRGLTIPIVYSSPDFTKPDPAARDAGDVGRACRFA